MNRNVASPLASIVLATALSLAATGAAVAGELTVNLHGIRVQGGLVKVAVVDSQQAWDGGAAPVQVDGAPAQGETAKFTFKDLKPGRYAVMVTHDENANGKLDMNVMGMPLEGYGFSNNPSVMRKPTWEEAGFEVSGSDAAIDVALR
ncbi:MAG: DUF2141 domain-containing protein [Lysobacteraceae bacterium]|nr:MAG: DUF2141 domain-containing protein [Xanthomonadaceae bacterium]